MTEYFYQLDSVEHITDSLLLEVSSRTDWFESNGFKILKVNSTFFKDTKLNTLIQDFRATPLIFHMDPMTWYNWHIDSTRHCSINMILSGDRSHCFYGDDVSRDIVKLTELIYEPNRFYLLNTRHKHAVLNLNNTRYMLSIGFEYPANYHLVLNYCKEHGL